MPPSAMVKRPPHDNESEIALWNPKRSPREPVSLSVVIVHADLAIADSIALLLRLKGFMAVAVSDLESAALMLEHWTPDALLIDTRLCRRSNFELVKRACQDERLRSILLIALTDINVVELPRDIQRKGFDGLCRRPCPTWRLADMLQQALE